MPWTNYLSFTSKFNMFSVFSFCPPFILLTSSIDSLSSFTGYASRLKKVIPKTPSTQKHWCMPIVDLLFNGFCANISKSVINNDTSNNWMSWISRGVGQFGMLMKVFRCDFNLVRGWMRKGSIYLFILYNLEPFCFYL